MFWPDGLLDAYIAMIPRLMVVLLLLDKGLSAFFLLSLVIWASARMGQLDGWFRSWVPDSVFSVGREGERRGGRSSVEAWYATALDIDKVLTVDRGILDCVLSSLGLPAWFRHVYFECHPHVRLRFKLAAGFGEPWTRYGGFLRGAF